MIKWIRRVSTEAVEDHRLTVIIALGCAFAYTTTLGVAYAIDRNTEYIDQMFSFGEIDDN